VITCLLEATTSVTLRVPGSGRDGHGGGLQLLERRQLGNYCVLAGREAVEDVRAVCRGDGGFLLAVAAPGFDASGGNGSAGLVENGSSDEAGLGKCRNGSCQKAKYRSKGVTQQLSMIPEARVWTLRTSDFGDRYVSPANLLLWQ
jgi:hypothetical protein